MNRILRSLVCICAFVGGVLGQSNSDWFKTSIWGGPGGALARPPVIKKSTLAEIRAEAFTAGNIVVCRVGTGAASLDSSATAVFLDELTPDGTFVSTVAMPTAPSGLHFALTNSGSNTTECQITRSTDGRYIIVPGYAELPGFLNVSTSIGKRVFGRVDATGSVDTRSAISTYGSSTVRSATSVDGSGIWSVGSSNGVLYLPFGTVDGHTQVSSAVTQNRVINIFGGQLYTSGRSGSYRVGTVGSGTPTSSFNSMTHLPGYSLSDNSVGFYLADLSTSVAGLDTIYVADDQTGTGQHGGGIKKFSLVSGTWTYNGTFPASASPAIPATIFLGLTGTVTSGITVTLYATRGTAAGNQLVRFVDSTGYNSAPTAVPTLLRTAAANTVFRGVALAPETTLVAPAVVTNAATDLAPNSATLNGTANPNGSATTGYFRVATTDPGTCNDSFGTRAPASGGSDLGSGTTSVSYSQNISGLSQSTTYYYCAIAQNAGGTSFGSVQSFTTPLPNVSIDNVSQSEGDAGTTTFTFTVSLSAPAGPGGVTFDIATADGTAQDDAPSTEDEDYVAKSLTGQTIPQGSSSYQFTVSVHGDTGVESNETFFVNVTNVTGASVADGQGAGTIVNDDTGPLNLVVTTTADTNDGTCDANCSLREAVAAANLNAGADTISFDPVLVSTPVTISLTGGALTITESVTITGPGADVLTLNAGGLSQIFVIGTGTTVEISGMSMTGGFTGDEGGAIFSDGNLTLNRVHIYGNNARFGGAVLNWGIDTELNIYDSTIANNTALDVGAIYALGPLIMRNSTISGNTVSGRAGAIFFDDNPVVTHMIVNSTITGNFAASEGGVLSYFAEVVFSNNIIAGNNSTSGSKDYSGPGVAPVSVGWNLIGVVSDAAWFNETGDQKGSSGSPLDPMLSPLANNGGPTPTHAFDLSSGISPAIDKGTSSGMLDQRGYQRTVDLSFIANATGGDGTDVGAYELQAPTAAPVTIAGRVLDSAGQPLHKAVVTLTGQDGSEKSTKTDRRGNFRFNGVNGGEGYVLSVTMKKYRFDLVFVNADADVAGLEIYAK